MLPVSAKGIQKQALIGRSLDEATDKVRLSFNHQGR
jgi:hypothetical protein